jgi:hypothetical protein
MYAPARVKASKPKKKRSAPSELRIIKVLADDRSPPFAYTVGLDPEIVVFGLNDDLSFMHHVLETIGTRMHKGEKFAHGDKKKNILPGFVCELARFPKSAYDEHLGQALNHHGKKPFRALQCIWPDPKKKMPWDPKVMLPILRRQPIFNRPDAGAKDPPWPFAEPHSHVVITSRQVATGKESIRFVGRDEDGDWQFVCNTTDDEADIVATTLGWVMDHDPSVKAAAKLKPGQALVRSGPKAAWKKATPPG